MCTFLLQNDALWDMGLAHCGICAIGLSENLYCISKEEPTKICLGPFKIHMVRAQVPWLKIIYQCIWPKQLMCIKMAWLAEWFFTLVTYSGIFFFFLGGGGGCQKSIGWARGIFTGPVKCFGTMSRHAYKPKCLWRSGSSVTARNLLYFMMA